MKRKLSVKLKKKFFVIILIVLPVLFLVGFLVSLKIALMLNLIVDKKGVTIVALSFIPLYLICILTVYNSLLRQSEKDRPKDI